MLTTEYVEIPKGTAWTLIEVGSSVAFSIQNTAEVMMEYTFTEPIIRGAYLTPYTEIVGIQQDIYVRFADAAQNGAISVTREA